MSSGPWVVDSSVWIEILNKGELAKDCMRELKSASQIYVPTLVIYEVYKKIVSVLSEDQSLSAVTVLSQNEVVDMSREVALTAADLSLQLKLPMADSIVLAHARLLNATLLTLDNDFAGITGTKVLR
jgi:predicted nucleic acid-binding protein